MKAIDTAWKRSGHYRGEAPCDGRKLSGSRLVWPRERGPLLYSTQNRGNKLGVQSKQVLQMERKAVLLLAEGPGFQLTLAADTGVMLEDRVHCRSGPQLWLEIEPSKWATVLRESKIIPGLRTRMIVAMVGLVCSDQLS